jgi:hypothetical protein
MPGGITSAGPVEVSCLLQDTRVGLGGRCRLENEKGRVKGGVERPDLRAVGLERNLPKAKLYYVSVRHKLLIREVEAPKRCWRSNKTLWPAALE